MTRFDTIETYPQGSRLMIERRRTLRRVVFNSPIAGRIELGMVSGGLAYIQARKLAKNFAEQLRAYLRRG